jgi:3-dehydroquinate dehydratase/shikimate dehydrogenase
MGVLPLLLASIAAIGLGTMTHLAVPIAAKNLDRAGRQVSTALAAGADMLELRTDYLEDLSVDLVTNLVSQTRDAMRRPVPIIVTCRDKQQGGAVAYPQHLRVDVLIAALKAGAEFIDFEYENFFAAEDQERLKVALSNTPDGRLILSTHNFEAKFSDVKKRYDDILTVFPAAIPKIVYAADHINDCFDAFDLLHRAQGELIVFCMGEAGLISRIIAKKLGSLVTFASIDEQSATAPGQLTIAQLKQLYRYDSINSQTELLGVIADPVGHSLSPAIHSACLAEKNMNALYLPLLVQGGKQEFEAFLDNVLSREWLDFHGFSVTIPHKQNALQYVRAKEGFVEPLAEKIGAVNTLVVGAEGRLSAYNTDYAAALDAVTSGMRISRAGLDGLSVAVVGAGGVARAIVAGLSDAGAKIKIYNRTIAKAEKLAVEFGCEFAPLGDLAIFSAKLIINCTSVGMYPNVDATPLPGDFLKSDMTVFDTIYNPGETLLLKQAKKAGAKTIDGLSMFINQALAQFKLFTGQDANPALMRETVLSCLSAR